MPNNKDIDRSKFEATPRKIATFSLPEEMYMIVKEFAWRKFRYLSEVIRAALIEYLEKHDERWEEYGHKIEHYRHPKLSAAKKLRDVELSELIRLRKE